MKAAQPPAAERIRRWNATQGGDLATKVLIGINAAVFVLTAISGGGLGSTDSELHVRFALWAPAVADGEYWRLLTSGFLHYGPFHVAMNMFALYRLGQALESVLGRVRFVGVYVASLLAGSACVMVFAHFGNGRNALTAGASGAIFGLLGCLAMGMKARGVSIMRSGLGVTLLINAVFTLGIPGISIGGHLGGFIGGAICGWLLLSPRPPISRQLANRAPELVAVASLIISVLAVR